MGLTGQLGDLLFGIGEANAHGPDFTGPGGEGAIVIATPIAKPRARPIKAEQGHEQGNGMHGLPAQGLTNSKSVLTPSRRPGPAEMQMPFRLDDGKGRIGKLFKKHGGIHLAFQGLVERNETGIKIQGSAKAGPMIQNAGADRFGGAALGCGRQPIPQSAQVPPQGLLS